MQAIYDKLTLTDRKLKQMRVKPRLIAFRGEPGVVCGSLETEEPRQRIATARSESLSSLAKGQTVFDIVSMPDAVSAAPNRKPCTRSGLT